MNMPPIRGTLDVAAKPRVLVTATIVWTHEAISYS